MERKGTAVWEGGGLKDGHGFVSTASGALHHEAYSFATRFEESPGTNPEELIGAAHAACFAMALSHEIEKVGQKPESLEASAVVKLSMRPDGWAITHVQLSVMGRVPGMDVPSFLQAAEAAKANCPVSRLLKAEIELRAHLHADTEPEQEAV
jgi:osmotically inducible protein OsmC